jgi:putative DNA-invertase from lambdoid prophage Rac
MPTQPKRSSADKLARYLVPPTKREKAALAKLKDTPPPRTFAYIRVSTDEQAEHGQSLRVQTEQLHGWAMQHQRTIDEVITEAGVSGGIPFHERPEGGKLFQLVQRGDTVVASKLDRAFRSARDCLEVVETFRQRGVSLYLLDLNGGADDVSGNGIARLFLTIVSAFAEFERDRIGERIRATKRAQKARGEYSGGQIAFGWERDGDRLVEVPELQAAIKKMKRMRAQGKSLRAIRDAIRASGVAISHMGVQGALGEVSGKRGNGA